MPLNRGLSSPSFLLAGSKGANRRGRTGCVIELIDRVALTQVTQIRGDNPVALVRVLRGDEVLIKTTLMIARLCGLFLLVLDVGPNAAAPALVVCLG